MREYVFLASEEYIINKVDDEEPLIFNEGKKI
jgi:hypothetical protein